jgi:hypothetical protein
MSEFIGQLVSSTQYLPYDRYQEVYGIKLVVLPEVSASFPAAIASVYESIFTTGEQTDVQLRTALLESIETYEIGQRVGWRGGTYYESIGEPLKWEQYEGNLEMVDFIWEMDASITYESNSGRDNQIAGILEHQLHTLNSIGFKYTFPFRWDYGDSSSDINLAMQEAYSAGIYNTDGMYDGIDSEGLMEVLPQEFAFWFIVTAWDYMEEYFPDKEGEWSLKTSTELQQQLPLAYKLYQETVLPVLSKPDKALLDALIFVGAETSVNSSDEQSSEVDVMAFTISSADESITAIGLKIKLSVDVNRADYAVVRPDDSVDTWTISGSDIGTDTLIGFKRVEFDDGVLALDIDAGDTAGQAYRLYQAAFARTPDMSGVSYHMNDMEGNGLALENVANNFIASPEFKTKYGENPSDDVFIDLLYQNVLGRSADDDGLAFYKNHFNEGTMTRAAALIGFAESPENVTLVAPQIDDGIWLAS